MTMRQAILLVSASVGALVAAAAAALSRSSATSRA